jgi:hypothetical protein
MVLQFPDQLLFLKFEANLSELEQFAQKRANRSTMFFTCKIASDFNFVVRVARPSSTPPPQSQNMDNPSTNSPIKKKSKKQGGTSFCLDERLVSK